MEATHFFSNKNVSYYKHIAHQHLWTFAVWGHKIVGPGIPSWVGRRFGFCKKLPSHIMVTCKTWLLCHSVWAYAGVPQNFWVLVPHPFTLRREGARSTLKHVSSVDGLTCRPNSVAVAVGASTCSRSVQIIGTSGPPFKVIKITERYAVRADTCDFLLAIVIVIVISKNCGPTSYRFRDKRRYWTKTAHFPILCI